MKLRATRSIFQIVKKTCQFQVHLYVVPGEGNGVEHSEVAFMHQLSGNNLCYIPIGLLLYVNPTCSRLHLTCVCKN